VEPVCPETWQTSVVAEVTPGFEMLSDQLVAAAPLVPVFPVESL
jgi:hypothetical protein